MPNAPPELAILEKTQNLIVWSLRHIEKFPRVHRYGLGLRLEQRLDSLLEGLIEARYTRDRRPLLQRLNLELEFLRFQFRIANELRCLSTDSYGSASRFVNEIGQQLGSWIKSQWGSGDEAVRRTVDGPGELSQPAQCRPGRGPR